MTKMSKSETELMRLIWASTHPVTCGELLALLPTDKSWKTTTVLTFLSRLADKGMVSVTKQGKANVYGAAVNESEYRGQETRSFLEDMHGGSVKSMIASLYDSEELTKDEIDELKAGLSKR